MIPYWREEKNPLPKKIRGEAIGKRWKGPSLKRGGPFLFDGFQFLLGQFGLVGMGIFFDHALE